MCHQEPAFFCFSFTVAPQLAGNGRLCVGEMRIYSNSASPGSIRSGFLGRCHKMNLFFVRECWKLVVHNAKKRQSCGRWQYMESQMPRGGFDPLLEQILNGKRWPFPIHSQTGFRMISGSETRINLEPNPHFKPTHCCSMWNWQRGMCHSSSVWALCSSQTGAFSH